VSKRRRIDAAVSFARRRADAKSLRAGLRARVAGLAVLMLAFAGILPAHAAGNAPAGEKEPVKAITALIGDAACDSDSQCKTLAVGAKACGGPEYYLAWSTKRTDEAALREAAKSDLTAPRNTAANRGGVSNCVFVSDPGAYCAAANGTQVDPASKQAGTCRLRAAGRGGRVPVD